MEIESELKRTTYIKYLLSLMLHSFSFYLYAVFIIVFLILAILEKWHYFLILPLSILGVTIIYCIIWLENRFFLSEDSKRFFIKRHFTFGDDDIILKSAEYEQTFKWEDFAHWTIAGGCYVIYGSKGKSIFMSVSDVPADKVHEFEDLLKQQIDRITVNKIPKENKPAP
jgi:hypothetical protein